MTKTRLQLEENKQLHIEHRKIELPVVDMKIHAPISAIEEGMNPDSTATAGKARMPENCFDIINALYKEQK